jgi:hypothetical protein
MTVGRLGRPRPSVVEGWLDDNYPPEPAAQFKPGGTRSPSALVNTGAERAHCNGREYPRFEQARSISMVQRDAQC